ncbi:MAG: ATP-binding protein [Pseudomonadota bacterium]
MLAGDEVLAAAILDRLSHRSNVLQSQSRFYRLRDLAGILKKESA